MDTELLELSLEVVGPGTAEAQAAATSRTSTVSLVAGSDLLLYDDPDGRRVVLDFERLRRWTIDRAAGTFADDSLFASVGLRHFESPNREHIRQVIEASGGDGSPFAPIRIEHQLALLLPASRSRLVAHDDEVAATTGRGLLAFLRAGPSGASGSSRSRADPGDGIRIMDRGDQVIYQHAGEPWLVHARSGGLAQSCATIVQFLRYCWGGHPLILGELTKLDFVPAEIELRALSPPPFDRGPITVRAIAARRIPHPHPRTDHLRRVVAHDARDPLDPLMLAQPAREGAADEVIGKGLAQARALLRSGNEVDGFLRFLELTLEVEVALPPDLAAAWRAATDVRIRELTAVLGSPRDAASAREAMAILTRLRENLAHPNPVLDVFVAELSFTLGDPDRAKATLGRAIAANPRLVGAYKTLGDLYVARFDTARAWRCWDLARAICPSHPTLRPVFALEETLLSRYPEYFRTFET